MCRTDSSTRSRRRSANSRHKQGNRPSSVSPILHDSMTSGSAFILADGDLSAVDSIRIIGMYDNTIFRFLSIRRFCRSARGRPDPSEDRTPLATRPHRSFHTTPTRPRPSAMQSLECHIGGVRVEHFQLAPFVRESYGDLLCDPTRSLGALADPGRHAATSVATFCTRAARSATPGRPRRSTTSRPEPSST